jgi:hypothetical protein
VPSIRCDGALEACLQSTVKSLAMLLAIPPDPPAAFVRRSLTLSDAVAIWLARWLRTPRKVLLARYGCDSRRLYEIWEETHFVGSRELALDQLRERFPTIVERVDPGAHRRIPKTPHPSQLRLFD